MISSFYKKKAKQRGVLNSDTGAVTVVQRFGGALNLNVHFHTLFADGVFYENEFKRVPVTDQKVEQLVKNFRLRVVRSLKRKGFDLSYLEESDVDVHEFESEFPDMAEYIGESVTNGKINNNLVEKVGKIYEPSFEPISGKRCAYVDGFSLHANVYISKYNKKGLEHLCRYIL